MISRQKAGLVPGHVLFLFILLSDIEGLSWEAKSIDTTLYGSHAGG